MYWGRKRAVFENVLLTINDRWRTQIYLDTDEAKLRDGTNFIFLGKI